MLKKKKEKINYFGSFLQNTEIKWTLEDVVLEKYEEFFPSHYFLAFHRLNVERHICRLNNINNCWQLYLRKRLDNMKLSDSFPSHSPSFLKSRRN